MEESRQTGFDIVGTLPLELVLKVMKYLGPADIFFFFLNQRVCIKHPFRIAVCRPLNINIWSIDYIDFTLACF